MSIVQALYISISMEFMFVPSRNPKEIYKNVTYMGCEYVYMCVR